MGAGKSTVGKKLSKSLRFEFLDSDAIIARDQGLSINDIFKVFNEDYFRKLEATLLGKICNLDNIVVATGGGCILNPVTRNLLQQSGTICYLKVNIQQQMHRLSGNSYTNRPSLPMDNSLRLKFLQEKFLQRDEIYKSIANISIDTSQLSIPAIVKQISSILSDNYAYN